MLKSLPRVHCTGQCTCFPGPWWGGGGSLQEEACRPRADGSVRPLAPRPPRVSERQQCRPTAVPIKVKCNSSLESRPPSGTDTPSSPGLCCGALNGTACWGHSLESMSLAPKPQPPQCRPQRAPCALELGAMTSGHCPRRQLGP